MQICFTSPLCHCLSVVWYFVWTPYAVGVDRLFAVRLGTFTNLFATHGKTTDHSSKQEVRQTYMSNYQCCHLFRLFRMWIHRGWDHSLMGVFACFAVPPDKDGVRVCMWRLEQKKKINQKINKTLKLLQSTEQDPAESSSSFAERDSLLLRLIGGTSNV